MPDTTGGELLGELGFYTLAGHSDSPRDLVDEVRQAEALGIGSAFISERYNVKDASTLCGAAAAVSERIGIATAATNHNTRHPLVTATFGMTMDQLTGGRFALGLGRGFDPLFQAIGLPKITSAQLEDAADLLRRLWRGEKVLGHSGASGSYPYLGLMGEYHEDIPVLLVALGEKTLELAGRCMDAVVLHTFFSDHAVTRSVAAVRRGAEQAGRDPASVRIWSVLATVGDHLPEELRLKKLVGRLATYLQGYGDVLVEANGWDPAVLARFRADELVSGFQGALDAVGTTDDLQRVAALLPDEWLAASATGSASQVAAEVVRQFDLGVDSVICHGVTPEQLAPVLPAYRAIRPAGLASCPANPGRSAA